MSTVVFLTWTPVRYDPAQRPWSPAPSSRARPLLLVRLPIWIMSPRKASSGFMMRGSSPNAPSCGTFQFFMSMPFGTYRKARRTGALAGAANAGTIESRKGSATAAPTPLRNVLRGRDLPVMIIASPLRQTDCPRILHGNRFHVLSQTGSRRARAVRTLRPAGRPGPELAQRGPARCPPAGRQADDGLFVRSGPRPRPRPAGRQPSHAGPFWTMRVSALHGVAVQVLRAGVPVVLAVFERRVVHLDDRVLIARIVLAPAGELARSLLPRMMTSTPCVAAISLAIATPSSVSIITVTSMLSLIVAR